MPKGQHLLIDCHTVSRDVCLDDKRFLSVMARAAERAGANVINQVRYRFGADSPPGFTAFLLLDESHCSVHTYAEEGLVALDIFTCGGTDPLVLFRFINDEIDLGTVEIRSCDRFMAATSEIPALSLEHRIGEKSHVDPGIGEAGFGS
ncbi:MAG: adenosylmethionine decarboxylase [bacterium]